MYKSIEICAGAGGQALGLELAGFDHEILIEIDSLACQTLKNNRPLWNVVNADIKDFSAASYYGIDLFAGGVPCPPFSIAGKQLGHLDDRDLFPEALRMIEECNPRAVMLENVRGLLDDKFRFYRKKIIDKLNALGYRCDWKLINASNYNVSQLRPRAILVAFKKDIHRFFEWPLPSQNPPKTVGELLFPEISSMGWIHAEEWKEKANSIAPTLVGGSKKHGGADLGPTRAKQAWALLGVDGKGLADQPPGTNFNDMPRLTLKMVALIQGFPQKWEFTGKKTPVYRQIGNAFPPPVAYAIGLSIKNTLERYDNESSEKGGFKSKTAGLLS
jgi:DNA (cytosine-5)-methyltransferase 1